VRRWFFAVFSPSQAFCFSISGRSLLQYWQSGLNIYQDWRQRDFPCHVRDDCPQQKRSFSATCEWKPRPSSQTSSVLRRDLIKPFKLIYAQSCTRNNLLSLWQEDCAVAKIKVVYMYSGSFLYSTEPLPNTNRGLLNFWINLFAVNMINWLKIKKC
jgi:hypothetical protein